jgi:hypothetical protein
MKTTLEQFLIGVAPLIRKRVLQTKKPHTAKQIASVNHEDNFVHYWAGEAEDALMDEFILLFDMNHVSDELMKWFNARGNKDRFRCPFINEELRKLYKELQ